MEIYIIRIYRRDETDPTLLAGIVEEPEEPQSRAFANIAELMDILGSKAAFIKQKRKSRKTAQ